jgi:hypothetical protein
MSEKNRLQLMPPDATGEPTRHPDDGFRLAVPYPMGARTLRVLEAMVAALLPPPPAPRSEAIDGRVILYVRVLLQYMPRITAFGFVLLLHLLNFAPLWRFRHLRTLTRLSVAEASAVLHGLSVSRALVVRMLMLGPKGVVLSGYFDQDEVHAALDYEPLGFFRERIARRKALLAGAPEDMAEQALGTTGGDA